MARPVMKMVNYKPEESKAFFRNDECYNIGNHLYAAYQVSLGQLTKKTGNLYNISFKQITNGVHRFEKERIEGLRDKEGRGITSRLNDGQRERIDKLIHEDPEEHGYNSATWTGHMLIEWIGKEYGIHYKKAQIYNIIKSARLQLSKGRGTRGF